MPRVATALAWEFWARSRWWFAGIVVGLNSLVAFYETIRPEQTTAAGRAAWYLNIYNSLVAVGLVSVIGAVWHALNDHGTRFPRRLFTAPISTAAVVSYRMTLAVVASALACAISMGLANRLFDCEFPIAGPAGFFAAMTACVVAGWWSIADFRVAKVVGWQLVVASLAVWLVVWLHPDGIYKPARFWTTTTVSQWLIMAAYTAAAWVWAIVEVRRDRCGMFRDWPDLQQWYERVTRGLTWRRDGFRSSLAAQTWYEWRPRGLVLPGLLTVILVVIVVANCGRPDADRFASVWVAVLVGLPCWVAVINGVYFGHRSRTLEFNAFNATRPLSDSALAAATLRAAACSTLAAWGASVIAALVLLGWGAWASGLDPILEGLGECCGGSWTRALWLLPAASLLGAWTIAGLAATLFLAGRGWLILAAICLVVAWPFIGIGLALMGWTNVLWALGQVSMWGLGAGMLGGTIAGLTLALRRGFLGWRVVLGTTLAWLGLCVVYGLLTQWRFAPEMSGVLASLGVLALPVAPVAAAPLAVFWNRHR